MRARISRFTVLFSVLTVIIGLILAGSAFAGGGNTVTDNILSGNIKEADGTTGQNTNTGSGVKTGHIQDDAVTTTKIVNGAVTAPKLGIVCPDGQYLQYTIASGWVCSVGTPGPEGPQGPQGLQGPQGPVGPTPHYANVIVVAKSGGDFTDPAAAMNSITDASETSPYLIKIMPGVYYSSYIYAKDYVDMSGSGRENTKIVASGAQAISFSGYHGEVRDVTFEASGPVCYGNSCGFGSTIGITGSPRITNVVVNALGNSAGIAIWSGTPVLTNVDIYVDGTNYGHSSSNVDGIYMNGTGSVLYNGGIIRVKNGYWSHGVVMIFGNGIFKNLDIDTLTDNGPQYPNKRGMDIAWTSTAKIYNSVIRGNEAIIAETTDTGFVRGANLQLEGAVWISQNMNYKCVNCFNLNFDPLN